MWWVLTELCLYIVRGGLVGIYSSVQREQKKTAKQPMETTKRQFH